MGFNVIIFVLPMPVDLEYCPKQEFRKYFVLWFAVSIFDAHF